MAYFSCGCLRARVMAALEAILRGLFVHGCETREGTMSGVNLEWFPRFASGDEASDCCGRGISVAAGNSRALENWGMDAAVGMALYKNRVR